jgi:hypothetical protein
MFCLLDLALCLECPAAVILTDRHTLHRDLAALSIGAANERDAQPSIPSTRQ